MAFSGNQRTRLGNYGGPRSPYGSFAGKTEVVAEVAIYPGNATVAIRGPANAVTSILGPASAVVSISGPGNAVVAMKTSAN